MGIEPELQELLDRCKFHLNEIQKIAPKALVDKGGIRCKFYGDVIREVIMDYYGSK